MSCNFYSNPFEATSIQLTFEAMFDELDEKRKKDGKDKIVMLNRSSFPWIQTSLQDWIEACEKSFDDPEKMYKYMHDNMDRFAAGYLRTALDFCGEKHNYFHAETEIDLDKFAKGDEDSACKMSKLMTYASKTNYYFGYIVGAFTMLINHSMPFWARLGLGIACVVMTSMICSKLTTNHARKTLGS